MTSKECSRCKGRKPLFEFYDSGRRSECRTCICEKKRLAYSTTARHEAGIKQKFGLSKERFQEMLAEQDGVCAICFRPERSERFTTLTVDHDHSCCPSQSTCGKCVRRLLCHRCNKLIGFAEDNAVILRSAAEYVENMRKRR